MSTLRRISAALGVLIAASPALPAHADNGTVTVPPGLPPPIKLLSPDGKLSGKEVASANLAAHWRTHNDKPTRGDDGSVMWPFGASLPSIVCSPLYTCDLALQPGEVVNSAAAGDKVRWLIMPHVSGVGSARTTHLNIKPTDAGLTTNLTIYTERRTYVIQLTSTQTRWTPLTGFTYHEDQSAAWEQYRQTVGVGGGGSMTGDGPVNGAPLEFYKIDGDHPAWRPLHAYTDGQKTYVQFPTTLTYGEAPAMLGVVDDGGLFRKASEKALRYRVSGTLWTIDSVERHVELILGVGARQVRVDLTKEK